MFMIIRLSLNKINSKFLFDFFCYNDLKSIVCYINLYLQIEILKCLAVKR